VTFEFRADRAGTFPYYCNLQVEDGCRQMRGVLVVNPRK
jgi:plastocyanin